MPERTSDDQRRSITRYFQNWSIRQGISDPVAMRLAILTNCMAIVQTIIAIMCGVYFAIQMRPSESYTFLILVFLVILFGLIGISRARKIQKMSEIGETEEMKRLYRQGRTYICIFSMVYLIVTFGLLYYILN